jgi:hypothetical protein
VLGEVKGDAVTAHRDEEGKSRLESVLPVLRESKLFAEISGGRGGVTNAKCRHASFKL